MLYVDDIILAFNDIGLLKETKRFLTNHLETKDLGNASFVLEIKIHREVIIKELYREGTC